MAAIQGGVSGLLADVDVSNSLRVRLPQVNTRNGDTGNDIGKPNSVGAVRSFFENDPGGITGVPYLMSPRVSDDRKLQVGLDTPIFDYLFNQTAQDTNNWLFTSAILTATLSGGYLNLNSGNGLAASAGCVLSTKQYFQVNTASGVRIEFIGGITQPILPGENVYLGLGIPVSATAPPTDGIWLLANSSGWRIVSYFNGTLNGSVPTFTFNPVVGRMYSFKIVFNHRSVQLYIDDDLYCNYGAPAGFATQSFSSSLPVFLQYINSSAVSGTAMQFKVASVSVTNIDALQNKPWPIVQALRGLTAHQGYPGGTIGGTGNLTNNMALQTAAALSNTVASTGGITGLNGQANIAPTMATTTDGILQSFQNPAGTIAIPGKPLIVFGIRIQSAVNVVLANATPMINLYSLAFGHTAISLFTAESASFATGTTKAPRRIALGVEVLPTNAPVGTLGASIDVKFNAPIVVNPGEFIQTIMRYTTATSASGAILYTVMLDAVWG